MATSRPEEESELRLPGVQRAISSNETLESSPVSGSGVLTENEAVSRPALPDQSTTTSSRSREQEDGAMPANMAGSSPARVRGEVEDSPLLPFPPRPVELSSLSPTILPGPADTSSVASPILTPQPRRAFVFNPRAQPFLDVAHLFLRRGQGPQPVARDPMAVPGEAPMVGPRADPVTTERRRRDAVYHMAMVYRRLMSVDMDIVAEELGTHFRNVFGPEYDEEVVRVIQEEPDDPPEEVEDEEWL